MIKGIKKFSIDCTGDVCVGDTILFTEAVFGGSWKKPIFKGERRIAALVISDSYGAAKQQHTFSLKIIGSDGYEPLKNGEKTRRKGRNVYRNGTKRLAWEAEDDRQVSLNDKHERGDCARAARDIRKMERY